MLLLIVNLVSANRLQNVTTRQSCDHGNREDTSQVLVVFYIANIP